jgi:hypothetical protein
MSTEALSPRMQIVRSHLGTRALITDCTKLSIRQNVIKHRENRPIEYRTESWNPMYKQTV